MVFESIVTDLMNRFLGDFIENLDKKQLNIGIWGGKQSILGNERILLRYSPANCTVLSVCVPLIKTTGTDRAQNERKLSAQTRRVSRPLSRIFYSFSENDFSSACILSYGEFYFETLICKELHPCSSERTNCYSSTVYVLANARNHRLLHE